MDRVPSDVAPYIKPPGCLPCEKIQDSRKKERKNEREDELRTTTETQKRQEIRKDDLRTKHDGDHETHPWAERQGQITKTDPSCTSLLEDDSQAKHELHMKTNKIAT